MASAISKYSFINAKLRAKISQILPEETFSQLAKATSIDALLAMLREGSFAKLEEVYTSTGDIKFAELELLKYEIELYRDIHKSIHSDMKPVINALLTSFEIENLKNAIRIYFKSKVMNKFDESGSHYLLYEPIFHNLPIDEIINAKSLEEIADLCKDSPYGEIIREFSSDVESQGSLFRLEIGLDHYYYRNLLSTMRSLDSEDQSVAMRLIGVEIDLQNISWIIRLKKFYDLSLQEILLVVIPGGGVIKNKLIEELYSSSNFIDVFGGVLGSYPEISSLLSSQVSDEISKLRIIEKILEEIKKHEVKRIMTGYPFTIGIILAYFILKSDELRKLRTILNAKQYGISQDQLERMI